MAKSSIHLQTAKGGTILHNARENYSKSVVFTDEKNEIWNDSKTAFKMFRDELEIRAKAYTERTGQKLHKNTSTLISGVVNLEQHHTLENLIPIKKYLENKFDTKVIQMSIHRDEGKLISIDDEDIKLVSGIDFFLNPADKKLYHEKEFINEVNMSEWKMEKNYHGHFEMLGLDTQGKTFRHKMNMYALKQLQDFTAETLKMERTPSNVIVENGKTKRKNTSNSKRLDTHEFKAKAKAKNDAIKESLKDKAELKKDNKILKQELEELKKENLKFREELKANQSEREHYKLQEQLNKQLQIDLKANKIELSEALDKIEELKKDIFHPTLKKSDDTPATNLEVANHYIKQNKSLEEKIEELKKDIFHPTLKKSDDTPATNLEVANHYIKQNKSLKEQNKVLENKVSTLEAKSIPTQIINDYELLKKENESLKKENSFLKRVVEKVLIYANSKIRELINFGKPQVKQSVSLEDFKEEDKKEDTNKSILNSLERLNDNLDKFVSTEKKKEDLEYSEYHNNLIQR